MSRFSHNICVDCWNEKNPTRPAHAVVGAKEEICCYCCRITSAGIYIRENPGDVPCNGEHPYKPGPVKDAPRFNIGDRVRSKEQPTKVGTVTGIAAELNAQSKRVLTVVFDWDKTPESWNAEGLELIPKPKDGAATDVLLCETPVLLVGNEGAPQLCGNTASWICTVVVMGVKVIKELPMCNTCAHHFRTAGMQVLVQPLSEVMLANEASAKAMIDATDKMKQAAAAGKGKVTLS